MVDMKNIYEFPLLKDFLRVIDLIYQSGWGENNGGNVSVMIDESLLLDYLDINKVIRVIDLSFDASYLANKYFIVTATSSYFRNIKKDPESLLGIFKVSPNGKQVFLLWGYKANNLFTSELPTHLMVHASRLKIDPLNRVVMHCHPNSIITMSHVHELNDQSFSLSLWRTMTEAIVVFPEGVGVLPWMQSGTTEIGIATSEKIKNHRLVIWAMHGIYGVGQSLDTVFGLIEVAEKAAEIYLSCKPHEILNNITNDQLKEIAAFYKVKNVRYEFLK